MRLVATPEFWIISSSRQWIFSDVLSLETRRKKVLVDMADLNERLLNRGIKNFQDYVQQLEPLEISLAINKTDKHQFRESIKPLKKSELAWDNLEDVLYELASRHNSLAAQPNKPWSGRTAQEATETITRYGDWMKNTADNVMETHGLCHDWLKAYRDVWENVVNPVKIVENRVQVAHLKNTDNSGSNTKTIDELDEVYANWTVRNDRAVMEYYRAALKIASKLEPFTEPPRSPGDS